MDNLKLTVDMFLQQYVVPFQNIMKRPKCELHCWNLRDTLAPLRLGHAISSPWHIFVFPLQIFLCPCFLFLYGSAVCFNELSTFAILKFQAKLCPLIPSVDNSCFNWTLPASYYQLSSHWDVWIELLLMKLKFGQKGNNITNLTFLAVQDSSISYIVCLSFCLLGPTNNQSRRSIKEWP